MGGGGLGGREERLQLGGGEREREERLVWWGEGDWVGREGRLKLIIYRCYQIITDFEL